MVRGGGKSLLWRLEVVKKVCCGGDGGCCDLEKKEGKKIDFFFVIFVYL